MQWSKVVQTNTIDWADDEEGVEEIEIPKTQEVQKSGQIKQEEFPSFGDKANFPTLGAGPSKKNQGDYNKKDGRGRGKGKKQVLSLEEINQVDEKYRPGKQQQEILGIDASGKPIYRENKSYRGYKNKYNNFDDNKGGFDDRRGGADRAESSRRGRWGGLDNNDLDVDSIDDWGKGKRTEEAPSTSFFERRGTDGPRKKFSIETPVEVESVDNWRKPSKDLDNQANGVADTENWMDKRQPSVQSSPRRLATLTKPTYKPKSDFLGSSLKRGQGDVQTPDVDTSVDWKNKPQPTNQETPALETSTDWRKQAPSTSQQPDPLDNVDWKKKDAPVQDPKYQESQVGTSRPKQGSFGFSEQGPSDVEPVWVKKPQPQEPTVDKTQTLQPPAPRGGAAPQGRKDSDFMGIQTGKADENVWSKRKQEREEQEKLTENGSIQHQGTSLVETDESKQAPPEVQERAHRSQEPTKADEGPWKKNVAQTQPSVDIEQPVLRDDNYEESQMESGAQENGFGRANTRRPSKFYGAKPGQADSESVWGKTVPKEEQQQGTSYEGQGRRERFGPRESNGFRNQNRGDTNVDWNKNKSDSRNVSEFGNNRRNDRYQSREDRPPRNRNYNGNNNSFQSGEILNNDRGEGDNSFQYREGGNSRNGYGNRQHRDGERGGRGRGRYNREGREYESSQRDQDRYNGRSNNRQRADSSRYNQKPSNSDEVQEQTSQNLAQSTQDNQQQQHEIPEQQRNNYRGEWNNERRSQQYKGNNQRGNGRNRRREDNNNSNNKRQESVKEETPKEEVPVVEDGWTAVNAKKRGNKK